MPNDTLSEGDKLALVQQLRNSLARTYYSMAGLLGLKRLQDYMQGASSLPSSTTPVWVLGVYHGLHTEMEAAVLEDSASRLWMTYRKDFPPLGSSGLTSDVGWGCTLRSGQMMLAEGLLQHWLGREWRSSAGAASQALARLLALFWDSPAPQHPFSIHNLCAAGKACGVKAGEWLGPWVLCHALEAAVAAAPSVGLTVHIVAEPGGGAPILYTSRVQQLFQERQQQHQVVKPQEEAVSAAAPSPGLLVLLPLTLGIGKINPRYLPQLQAVLTFPQSIGVVGGRPGSSLYFIGFQGEHVLHLDPHEVQEACGEPGDPSTYHCPSLRLMPLHSIDPSLAIGFYCSSLESVKDLCGRLLDVERKSEGAPLVSVSDAEPQTAWQQDLDHADAFTGDSDNEQLSPAADGKRPEEWEML